MSSLRLSVCFLLAAILFSSSSLLRSEDAPSLEARRNHLKQLLAEEWEYELRESPEFATTVGDYRYNDRWSDASLAHVQVQKQDEQKWLARFEAVDIAGFPEQEKLNQ